MNEDNLNKKRLHRSLMLFCKNSADSFLQQDINYLQSLTELPFDLLFNSDFFHYSLCDGKFFYCQLYRLINGLIFDILSGLYLMFS